MDHEFWHERWKEGSIGFHRSDVHPELIFGLQNLQHSLPKEPKTLVPLCGKTLDMLWLLEQDHVVTGVELCAQAIDEFLQDNNLLAEKGKDGVFHLPCLDLVVGDYFQFQQPNSFDLIYDRAAIVALPPQMREEYAKHSLSLLKPQGKILLISFEYDQTKVAGPPHSVTAAEIKEIYKGTTIELIHEKSEKPKGPKFVDNGVRSIIQKTFVITKN